MGYIQDLGMKAKACKGRIATASTMEKNDALLEIAFVLRRCKAEIIEANNIDIENARARKMS